MSETSSNTESSCGWTIISNEGSDIETLGPETAVEYGTDMTECRPGVEPELQDPPASLSGAGSVEERGDSLEDTLKEEPLDETLSASEAGCVTAKKEHVALSSSSDHSDIVTFGDMKEDEHAAVEEEAAANEEFYLGTSYSSQYAFTAVQTALPVQQPAVANSSSSEDEAVGSPSTVVRRRRLRKNTTCTVTEPEEQTLESGPSEEVREEVHHDVQAEVSPTVTPPLQGHVGGTLNKCILLALVIAFSMGFGHFYGTAQILERQKTVEKTRVNEFGDARDLLQKHLKEQLVIKQEVISSLKEDLDDHDIVQSLTGVIERITEENQELRLKLAQIQAQRNDLKMQLKQTAEERTNVASRQQKLTAENQLLKGSLEREEKSLSTLQEELGNLRSKIRDLEERGAGADSLLSENQRLKDQLEEEKQLIRSFLGQKEGLVADAQALRKELDKERRVTDELRKELNQLSSHNTGAGEEASSETELQSRLIELEKKLSFEQQRSELRERLYVETKEEGAKGDTQSKVKETKEGMIRKVKETFDAVKNSTKEFVHHHKEQIKKAKEAVKENLRKFSGSVKSTFRHFKDSASTLLEQLGSDIETLGPETAVEYGTDMTECRPGVEPELQDPPASLSGAGSVEERGDSLEDTLKEEPLDETLSASEAGCVTAKKEHVALSSSSDHSDIVTFGDMKEDEHAAVEEEAAANEEFYLGTSCSSQYAFTAVQTALPVQQPAVANSSSSEDEAVGSPSTVVRRRRLRKNTTCTVTEPEEQTLESGPSEEEEEEVGEEVHHDVQAEVPPTVTPPLQGHVGGTLNKCILLALVIAFSMGFGHFYGTVQILERQKTVEKTRVNEFGDARDLLQKHLKEQLVIKQEVISSLKEDLDDHDIVQSLTGVIERITEENQELRLKLAQIQAQRNDLKMQLKQTAEERTNVASRQQKLTAENQLLKGSLEREEKSLSTLQEELGNLRSKIRDLEERGAGADSLLSENQRLKDQLEEEKQLIRSFLGQKEGLVADAQALRKELDKERRVTDELRKELNQLSSHNTGAGEEASSETELQSRLIELEKKLSFEQQRSDLWERLYVETKEEGAKGDTQSKVKKTKEGMIRKVKETFDAVKNSTKEFVHHHKEQIKKAKEAVKENLRKFSDSVKSTFRHFKDSASTFIHKARGSNRRFDEKDAKESWQHRFHKPQHSHKSTGDFSKCNHNTRKTGGKFQDQNKSTHKAAPKGCVGVFDCAYQESMSLFNKAMEPIRADEFNQLLQSYLQQEVDHFHHWKELDKFINNFFHNGVFIHDQMLFTDFVSGVEDYLEDMHEYHGLDDDVFEDLDEYVYRHFFGNTYSKNHGPSRPFERPDTDSKEEQRAKQQQRKQQRAKPRPQRERKWSRSGRNTDRHIADVKIELGPMPFDPKY
ncbi:cell cycle progression protein 1 [Diretmus argenteus]